MKDYLMYVNTHEMGAVETQAYNFYLLVNDFPKSCTWTFVSGVILWWLLERSSSLCCF